MAPRSRKSTLGEIRNPLVFFGLALLVIEAIMGGVAATSNLGPTLVFAAICVMAGLFLVVVGAVAFITIKWPAHLYEEVRRDIKWSRQANELLKGKAFRDAVKDVVSEAVKRECLSSQSSDMEKQ
jgi:heme A synthase